MQHYFICPGRFKKFCTDQTLKYTLEFRGKAEKSEFVLQTERGRVDDVQYDPIVCSFVCCPHTSHMYFNYFHVPAL